MIESHWSYFMDLNSYLDVSDFCCQFAVILKVKSEVQVCPSYSRFHAIET